MHQGARKASINSICNYYERSPIVKWFENPMSFCKFGNIKISTPNFFEGIAHLLDIGATLGPHITKIHLDDDFEAISQDWRNVGNDMRAAMSKYGVKPHGQIQKKNS